MTRRGVTLIELLVVVSIIGILMVALGFSVNGWTQRYDVESVTRQLYADMQDARTRAMQGDGYYFLVINTVPGSSGRRPVTSYSVFENTKQKEQYVAGDLAISSDFPKQLPYLAAAYDSSNAAVALPITLTFTNRGLISASPSTTAEINIVADNLSDYNCTTIGQTMIGLGKTVCSNNASKACSKDSDCGSGGKCSVCQVK